MNFLSFKRLALLLSCLTFSLMALASSKQSYVAIGDMIQVNLPGETQLNQAFLVDRRGAIKLPEIGSIFVAGYSEEQLTNEVKLRLGEVYRDLTNVEVFIAQKQLIINVLGYVENPGEKVLDQATTIQEAFSAAGGIRSGAQLDKVQLKRGKTVTVFDYKQFLETGEESALPSLQSMDTLFVPASPLVGNIEQDFNPTALANAGDSASSNTSIKVFGEVNAPGSFSFKADTSLVDILMRSGGVTRYASVEQIRIISDNTPTLFNLKKYLDSGDSALLPILKPGSTVFVPKQEEEIKAGANVVYVMGEVAIPGAYEGKPGASFMDILANAGGPTRFAESRQIRIIKANGQVIRFDMVAYTEGSGSSPLPAIVSGDAIFVPEKLDMNEKSWLKVTPDRAVNVFGEVTRPGRIEWSDEMDLMDLLAHVGGPTLRADTTRIEIVPSAGSQRMQHFNLDEFIKNGAPRHTLPRINAGAIIRVHDLPQDPSDNKSQWVRQSSDSSIYVFGQVNAPGRYRFTDEMHFLDILSAADGPTGQADIHNIRITHRDKSYARVSKLNLSQYFETGDESLLPKVKRGDTIYIPEKDRNWLERSKESTIRVLGAVNQPGRYQFDDTMTILDLLAEAGGPSKSAYLEKITIVNMSCCQNQARTFDLVEFSKSASIHNLPVLRAGDTVYIPDESESLAAQLRTGIKDIFQMAATVALIGAL
ncbi:SLBB domain-containing protein [Vibrio fluvialis]|uniref:SLBB domain-containing protein n=1 Tax=Vibrio fluvialis TaxID=676 RepID=UPI00130244B1|nr:SLBB domain-containing protein [Vibrio fluvialis]EKO3390556.1 SLBB domain-containing protein [Vibrio fluvialis]EKO3987808.1 sugar ABC transporter substrate-binding protein [Vibrio fluvialis]ELG2042134.1 SLBB domain-containing protein [Vibrio fluvialis]MBY7785538.1 SLBB domain-containing protein [Vibrio fluvialis]MBY7896002.1 SLBB domain-containing protein [Vibrio fluvialis]